MSSRGTRIFVRVLLGLTLLIPGALTASGLIWYRHFTHHITAQEVSHEVVRSTFHVKLRGNSDFAVDLYQRANTEARPLVLFTSGDGGWSPFCADIAAHMAANGYSVVAFNAKDYLTSFGNSQKPVTVEELMKDYESVMNESLIQPGVDGQARVVLAGWSLGAGFSVVAGPDTQFATRLDRVVAISLPVYNELAWKPTDALIYLTHGVPREKVFDAHEFLRKLNTPVYIVNATDDDTSPLKDARSLFNVAAGPKRLFAIKASGHHFEGGETNFYLNLDEALTGQITPQ